MRTRSSSNLVGESSPNQTTSNPKRRNHRRSKQPISLKESPLDTMADQRTMAELLCAPTEGYAEAIVVPPILAEHFELKHNLINMMTSDQFFGLEKDNPHDHIRWFNKITSTIKYKDVNNLVIKLMLFPFSLAGAARRWLKKEPPRSILTWEDLVSKFINEFFPPSRTTNLRNEISKFQQPDQDSLNSAAGGNLLERRTQDVLTIIENKSKVRNSRNKSIVSQVKSSDVNFSSSEIAKLTHAVNQQTSAVTTAMTAILKQFQATPPLASVKSVEEICVTCGGAHPYYQCLAADGNTFLEFWDNIQGYVSTVAVNYNQEIEYLLNHDPTKEMDSILEDSIDEGSYEDFSEVDALPSTNNEDKRSETLLSFLSENEEKVFNPEILTSKGVHTSLLPELSHRGPKAFKVIKIFESPMEIFPCSYGEDIRVLDVPCLHFYPP
ncbi:reverse transcriptase domain-containing protein [Tanacetum coccineum]